MAWLILLGIAACLWLAYWLRRRGSRAAEELEARGLPAGASTLWQDLAPDPRWSPARRLADPVTRLRGSIDHAYRTREGRLVVGEFKAKRQVPAEPHESDVLQVGAYFLLCARDPAVREEPSHGILVYRDPDGEQRVFRLANTPELRARVLATLEALRLAETAETVRRSHEHRGRCRGCGWARWCNEALERP
ncbi:CRISPR-associated protein Cas4 [Nitrospira calida]|jgi:CRISPR/Cas system-associated exonuclease Cas4 (RecB family)